MFDVSNNYDVTAQSSYIDGFADGLFGAKVGGTAKSDVTFPDDYSAEELAGQPAAFEFTVKGIYEPVTMDNLTDEMVADAFTDEDESLTSKDALVSYVRNVLETQAANYKNQATVSAAEEYLIANSTVEIPDAYFLARLEEYEASFKRDYCEDQPLDEFLTANGTSIEEMTEEWTESLTEQIQVEFLFGRIADLEGIGVEEDDFSDFVDYLISSGDIDASTADDVYDYYGNGNREDGEQSLRQLFRVNQAITFVVEHADVTIENESEE
jgi:trigger factor